MRCIGLDVGQEACEVAIAEDGRIRSAGRIKTSRAELELFAQSLGPEDRVALEAGSGTLATARILEPHVARVVVANTKKLRQISHAKAKTDTLDARTLARLLAAGFLDEVWVPDEPTRALRRWIAPALGTGLAYLLNYRLIQDEGATTASTVTYLLPIVAVILGAIVLSEPITWNLFAGTAIVLAGVAASDQRVAARMRPSTTNQSPTLP